MIDIKSYEMFKEDFNIAKERIEKRENDEQTL